MMFYPQKVLSASSGMNYVNDPPTMYDNFNYINFCPIIL